MIYIKQHIVYLIFLMISVILINSHYLKQKQSIEKSYTKEIATLTSKYEQQISAYKTELSSVQLNNIVQTIIEYKPNGERVVTKTVDKTMKKSQENKVATNSEVKIADVKSDVKIEAKSEEISIVNSSSPHYMLGVGNLQLFSSQISDYSVLAGIKIPFLPIYTFLSVPVTKDFYKLTTLNAVYNF